MDVRPGIRSQYRAALEMLEKAVVACPDQLWNAAADRNRFWRVAYHAVFFTHFYLSESRERFVPWDKARAQERLADLASNLDAVPSDREAILGYIAFCRQLVDETVPSLDLGAESGFPWLRFDKLELQLYNLRHLAQHLGELMERLGTRASVDVEWVSDLG